MTWGVHFVDIPQNIHYRRINDVVEILQHKRIIDDHPPLLHAHINFFQLAIHNKLTTVFNMVSITNDNQVGLLNSWTTIIGGTTLMSMENLGSAWIYPSLIMVIYIERSSLIGSHR